MNKIASTSRPIDDAREFAKASAGRLSAENLAALARALNQRRDASPIGIWSWAELAEGVAFTPTDFGMETNDIRLLVMTSASRTPGLLARKKRNFWVFAGPRGEERLFPLSCHSSLALAAEFLMLAYAECCLL
jgi:hypothetical protein